MDIEVEMLLSCAHHLTGLSVQYFRGSNQLRLDPMRWCSECHESFCELKDELAAIIDL